MSCCRFARAASCAILCIASCKGDGKPKRLEAVVESTTADETRSKAPAQMVIGEMAIEVANPHPPMDGNQLAQALGRQLAGSGYFFAIEDEVDPTQAFRTAKFHVKIAHDIAITPNGVGVIAAIEATATWMDGDGGEALTDQVIGERTLDDIPEGKRGAATVAHVANTLEEVGRGLIEMEKVRTGPDALLWAALHDDNPRVVLFAVRQVGSRRPPAATDQIVPLLDSPSDEIRNAAITTLVALGDPAAVRPLVKNPNLEDPVRVHVIIEAVGALGGTDAEEYLEFVATGHPDERVQEHAREALASARRRSTVMR